MIRSSGALQSLPAAQFQLDADGVPRSARHDDSYFSRDGGDAESRHVFLDGACLAERMAAPGGGVLAVAELGFGTGLNFLSTWALLRECGIPGQRLHYWSIDAYPLRRGELEEALERWPQLRDLARELADAYPPPLSGVHRRVFDGGRVVLDCVWSDAASALADLASHRRRWVDAWFLDGFAPAHNRDMWDESLFSAMARCSRDGATVASYSAAGHVRRGLQAAGFTISRRPGFGGKRECISGELREAPGPAVAELTPWDQPEKPPAAPPASALVIGAGLAGAHAAAALAIRGVAVTVVDAGPVAGAASGNSQGVLFTRLSHRRSTLSDFSLFAHGYAAALYATMFENGKLLAGADGELSGCFQLPSPRGDHAALCGALAGLPELAAAMDADTAARHLGVRPAGDGIWQASAGWLSPPAVCAALLGGAGITVRERCGPLALRHSEGAWQAVDAGGAVQATAETVIVAAGLGSRVILEPYCELPLRPVRGQTTQLPAAGLTPLTASYCHRGYIAPAVGGHHCIGATFAPGDNRENLRIEDHQDNIAALAAALPDWAAPLNALSVASLDGRAAARAATPDYLPLCGPVPLAALFNERYAALARDARQLVDEPAPTLPGCYVSAGFGSRGLSYAALAAEQLAAGICGEIPPLSRELQRALSPARFPLRALVRGQGSEVPS